ncbi:MAG: prenyltransferase/squalene oxidase repeat-containing protein [Bryobacteraceae bacterium]
MRCERCVPLLLFPALLAAPASLERKLNLSTPQVETIRLEANETVEITAGIEAPSKLPANGRLAVEWAGPGGASGFRKVLHALDPDVYVVYRAPAAGEYRLRLAPVEDEAPVFNAPRWREGGIVSERMAFPARTPWPANVKAPVRLSVRRVDFGPSTRRLAVEAEPNDAIAQAQTLPFAPGNDEQSFHITGSADDIEYFDNGKYGESGDDWFRIEYKGSEPRLLHCNMTMTDPFVTARLRFYTADNQEYKDGRNANEITHEQTEEHRTAIVRLLKPGGVYFLRAEANSPGYDIELRVRRPAPYTDPREAVRMAVYDHTSQVDAWLLNRPRGNSLDRRLKDTGTLYGTNCMSCHTQSGVWGAAVPVEFGYRIENVANYRHLINVMYESLRPTNVLKDAANNTSLPPHDLGDGPAGTRVAGHNVRTAEAVIPPRKLHSAMQVRTANHILQSADPSGINAAGKGSNVGQGVVFHYAAEILRTAWDKTKDPKYLAGIEERARKLLALEPKFTDDIAHRVLFFRRVYPNPRGAQIEKQLQDDERALRATQRDDGSWGFTPGIKDPAEDPAPTALAVDALVSLGAGASDPAIEKAVAALLRLQDPYGRWNRSAKTGFVTTAYVMNTLARLYPDTPRLPSRADLEPRKGESLHDTIAKFRALAQIDARLDRGEPFFDLMLPGAAHASPQVRYWALIALGAQFSGKAVPALTKGLGDPVKFVREAARWGLRQTLIDDKGWSEVFAAYENGSDLTREALAAALVMRIDAVKPGSRVDFERLSALLNRMMNQDASPAVRAWASRAAWNWWIWNPPVRKGLNRGFLTLLERAEPSVLAANAHRYQLQALFIANGNRAAANYDHAYPELAELFEAAAKRLDSAPLDMADRIAAVAATYYNASYGSNGSGPLGYSTPHSSAMVGKAVVSYWERAEKAADEKGIQLAIESAANVIDEGVQKKLLHYAVKGPEKLRPIASTSLSDPRAVLLPASPEFVEPLMERINRAAVEEEGRRQVQRTMVRQLSRARWDIPVSEERQRTFFNLMMPKLDDASNDGQWFLADVLGSVFGANPDFRLETLVAMAPRSFRNPVEAYFWLPAMSWLVTHDSPVPEIAHSRWPAGREELRKFALGSYLKALEPGADARLRDLALRMLSETAWRTHPDVIAAVSKMRAGQAARFLPDRYRAEVEKTAAADPAVPKLALTPERWRNFDYFFDYVVPQMNLENREDGNACFTCHGGGRVPSFELVAPDRRTGYLAPRDAWTNYRAMLERIDGKDVEQSKILRKPLNVQTGEEDGHQGGRRFKPGDRGHEILRRWAADAARVAKN